MSAARSAQAEARPPRLRRVPDQGRPALHQPRAVVARLERPRPVPGEGPAQSAARAGPLPGDLREQPRRVLPGPGRGPPPAGGRAVCPRLARRPVRLGAAGADPARGPAPHGRALGHLRRDPQVPRRAGHLDRQVQQGAAAPRAPARALRRGDLPRPHAARSGPRPPVPVHQHAEPVDRGRAARSGQRRAPVRARQGPAGAAPPVRGRAGHLGPARPDHRQQPRPAVHRDGDHRRPHVPGDPQRRPRDRGGRGRRPAPGDRGGAPPAALRRGRPARGRAEHARRRPGGSCSTASGSAKRTATRSAGCST